MYYFRIFCVIIHSNTTTAKILNVFVSSKETFIQQKHLVKFMTLFVFMFFCTKHLDYFRSCTSLNLALGCFTSWIVLSIKIWSEWNALNSWVILLLGCILYWLHKILLPQYDLIMHAVIGTTSITGCPFRFNFHYLTLTKYNLQFYIDVDESFNFYKRHTILIFFHNS